MSTMMNSNNWMERLKEGRIHVLAGRPGSGKTRMAIEFLKQWAQSTGGKQAVYFSIEAQAGQIIHWLGEALNQVIVYDEPSVSPFRIGTRLVESRVEPVEWVVIDYLQLMKDRQDDSVLMDRGRIRTVFEDLEDIAQRHKVKILILSQLPRKIDDMYPMISDEELRELLLRESPVPSDIPNSISFAMIRDPFIINHARSSVMKIPMAKHEIKTPGKRGEDWARAVLNLDITERGLVVEISLNHGPDNTQPVNGYLADYVYQQIKLWFESMSRVTQISCTVFPAQSINGQWPTLDPLIHSVERLGVEVRRKRDGS